MSADIKYLRASSLPMAFICPASVRPAKVRLNASNDAAAAGTASHEVLRALPVTGRINWDGIAEVARRFNADPDETRMLSAQGARLWNQIKDSFTGALTEVRLECELAPGVKLTGHADLAAVSERALRIGDWKTGRRDADHSHQFKAYASMALLSTRDIDEATGTGLWVRDTSIENYTLDRAGAERWLDSLVSTVLNWDGVYRPSHNCRFCQRSHECDAHNALVRRDIAAFADKSLVARVESELHLMKPEEIVDVLRKADLVRRYAERVRDAVRDHVDKNGDLFAPGVRLTVEETLKREIDPLAAWPLLERLGFKDEDFARSMDLRVSRVEQIVREKAGKGSGASAVRALSKELIDAGAVRLIPTKRLEEKRS